MNITHDPLCPSAYTFGVCECALIDRVRRDEFTKAYRRGYNERGLADAKSQAMFGGWNYDPQATENRP